MEHPSERPVSTASTKRSEDQPTFLAQLWDGKTARVLSTIVLTIVALDFLRLARETLTLFLFAILFAYFLEPAVARLERPLRGRGKAILIVYLLLGTILAVLGFVFGPSIANEARALIMSLPSLLDRVGSGQLVAEVGHHYHLADSRVTQIQSFVEAHRAAILDYGKLAGAKLAAPAKHVWWLILIPVLSLFFLKQGSNIEAGAVGMGRSLHERTVIRGLLGDVNVMLGSYIRAQLILAGLTLIAYTVVLSLLRVSYAFILSPLGGFLEFIPVVGPAMGAALILIIAVLAGYPHAVWLVLFLGAWRLTQDYVNAPRIMGRSLEINPLLQIFAVLAGGEIAGVIGALIAVPVIALLRIVFRQVRGARTGVSRSLE